MHVVQTRRNAIDLAALTSLSLNYMCYTIKHVLTDPDEPAQIHPRFQALAEKTESEPGCGGQQDSATLPCSQPATS